MIKMVADSDTEEVLGVPAGTLRARTFIKLRWRYTFGLEFLRSWICSLKDFCSQRVPFLVDRGRDKLRCGALPRREGGVWWTRTSRGLIKKRNAIRRQPIGYFSTIALAAFVLNLIWEMAQMRTYADFAGQH